MNITRTETALSQTVEGTDVGDVIRGRFPEQIDQDEQDTTATAAQIAAGAGRIDVRDFSQMLSGLRVPQQPAPIDDDQAPAVPAPPAFSAPAAPVAEQPTEPTEAAPAGPGTSAEVWRITRLALAAVRGWSAERWRAEYERRAELRPERKHELAAAKAAFREAKRADPAHKTRGYHRAKRELRHARHAVPDTLPRFATKAGLATAALGYFTLPHVSMAAWVWFGAGLAATAVIGLAAVAGWVIRHPKPVPAITPTEEEQRILDRLAPAHWAANAEGRGLKDTITGTPELTESGITVSVRLDGKWTPEELAKAEGNIRALLGARTALRIEIKAGEWGGWASITLRTRFAGDGMDMTWNPERIGIGIDTVTGRPVAIPLDARLTIAGASGSGKSWSSRSLLAAAHLLGDAVFIDGKGEEATVWSKVCRTASEPDEIIAAVDEVFREMNRRKKEMKRREISVWDGRQLTLYVDEGRVILAMKNKKLLAQLIDISALGRSRGVVLWWATQYPTTSGNSAGIHPQIAANTDARFALRVKNLTHAQVALDDDADYGPHLIPATKEMRGHGYLAGYGAHLIRTWTMNDDAVKALPAQIWHGQAAADNEAAERPAAVLAIEDYAEPTDETASIDDRVLGAIARADEPLRQVEIVEATGARQGTVSKAIARLVTAGELVRDGNRLALPAENDDEQAAGA
jgi:S-DNA-T family DNA segregation ATPase FtsK/SpoIIIE